jgi:hypothetical protein
MWMLASEAQRRLDLATTCGCVVAGARLAYLLAGIPDSSRREANLGVGHDDVQPPAGDPGWREPPDIPLSPARTL